MKVARMQKLHWLHLAISLTLITQSIAFLPALAGSRSKDASSAPTGTLLLPMTPRIDDSVGSDGQSLPVLASPSVVTSAASKPSTQSAHANYAQAVQSEQQTAASLPAKPAAAKTLAAKTTTGAAATAAVINGNDAAIFAADQPSSATTTTTTTTDNSLQQDYTVESGTTDDGASTVDENSLLKGTVQIVADDTEYDQLKNTFLGTGNAVAIIAGQNSKLEADTILYDQNSETIDARGNVKILRNGQLTTGSSFKFKVNSDEYMITDPDTELQGTCVIARTATGNREGLSFKKGTFTLPRPFVMMSNVGYGPTSEAERYAEVQQHPEAYLPAKASFKFTARSMVYEKYKDAGQLTVFGGKLKFNNFTVPLPKFNASVGGANSRVVFPVTALAGNNMQIGGLNVGPQFNYAVGKTGAFSWAPLVQFGGRRLDGYVAEGEQGKVGAGFKLGYSSDRLNAHAGYGSNSNLFVADFKYKISNNNKFQAGVNRFLEDGWFGVRRARAIAELVDTRTIGNVPFLSSVQFRTSGGYAQDNPGLVNQSGSQYAQLFKPTGNGKIGAYKLQEQITVSSHPLFAVGDTRYGVNMTVFGAAALRAYSTGDSSTVLQIGPSVNARLGRIRMQGGYAQSSTSGSSPFVYDQFIQGTRSTFFNGDYKLAKWLTVGTSLGYNLDAKMMYSRALTAAIGPDDFKLVGRYDQITGWNRFGFDVMCGNPVNFQQLKMKGGPDAGQLGRGGI